jgi:hypothetical protein
LSIALSVSLSFWRIELVRPRRSKYCIGVHSDEDKATLLVVWLAHQGYAIAYPLPLFARLLGVLWKRHFISLRWRPRHFGFFGIDLLSSHQQLVEVQVGNPPGDSVQDLGC